MVHLDLECLRSQVCHSHRECLHSLVCLPKWVDHLVPECLLWEDHHNKWGRVTHDFSFKRKFDMDGNYEVK